MARVARAVAAVAVAPVALPILAAIVLQQRLRDRWPVGRPSTWYWRLWWWYGYHGLYQLHWWWLARRRARRSSP